jgi:hypothetical protein
LRRLLTALAIRLVAFITYTFTFTVFGYTAGVITTFDVLAGIDLNLNTFELSGRRSAGERHCWLVAFVTNALGLRSITVRSTGTIIRAFNIETGVHHRFDAFFDAICLTENITFLAHTSAFIAFRDTYGILSTLNRGAWISNDLGTFFTVALIPLIALTHPHITVGTTTGIDTTFYVGTGVFHIFNTRLAITFESFVTLTDAYIAIDNTGRIRSALYISARVGEFTLTRVIKAHTCDKPFTFVVIGFAVAATFREEFFGAYLWLLHTLARITAFI